MYERLCGVVFVVKHYVSEKRAITLLIKKSGVDITVEDMIDYASEGVVPAYFKFAPRDKLLYPGEHFRFVLDREKFELPPDQLTMDDVGEASEWRHFPFPLPENGVVRLVEGFVYEKIMVKVTEDLAYRLVVARSDGKLEAVSEHHIVRVYAPQEVQQAVENVKRYEKPLRHQPMEHSCGELFKAHEVELDEDKTKGWFMSPFADNANALNFKKRVRKDSSSTNDDLPGKDMDCMRLVIAAMRELVDELHKTLGKRRYSDGDLIEKLQEIMPNKHYRGMGEDSLKRSFASATSARNFERSKIEGSQDEN